jgi:hypothetical protein
MAAAYNYLHPCEWTLTSCNYRMLRMSADRRDQAHEISSYLAQVYAMDVRYASSFTLLAMQYIKLCAAMPFRWNFWTEGKDVAFGVYRRTAEIKNRGGNKLDGLETIVPNGRVNSHVIPEAGSVECHQTGICMSASSI